jgi:hypothetical protein
MNTASIQQQLPKPKMKISDATKRSIITAATSIFISIITGYFSLKTLAKNEVAHETNAAVPIAVKKEASLINFPVGTIVPYYGDLKALDDSYWRSCDGGPIPEGSPLEDANPTLGGRQLPDLQGKFIQGLEAGEKILDPITGKPQEGGANSIKMDTHQHMWASFIVSGKSNQWKSYNKQGQEIQVSAFNDGFGSDGKGEFPLDIDEAKSSQFFYTDSYEHNHGGDNRPSYTKFHWIIRVR